MGRTHDYHCDTCHSWIDGFSKEAEKQICLCGGKLDYDINNEGCENCRCFTCKGTGTTGNPYSGFYDKNTTEGSTTSWKYCGSCEGSGQRQH